MTTEIMLRSTWKQAQATAHKWFADIEYEVAAARLSRLMASKKNVHENSRSEQMIEPPKVYDRCTICSRPLGQDSKDLYFQLCHECRKCKNCSLDVKPAEADYCMKENLPIKHMRCMTAKDTSTLQQQIDVQNRFRLVHEAMFNIENSSFDEKYQFLRMLQDKTAELSLLLNRDKKSLNQQLNAEKHEKEEKKAETKKTQVAISSKVERKHLTEAAKAINALTKNGVSYRDAAKIIFNQEVNTKKRTPEQARLTILEAMISLGTPKEDAAATFDGKLN